MAPKKRRATKKEALEDDIPSSVEHTPSVRSADDVVVDEHKEALLKGVTGRLSESHLPHAEELVNLLGLVDGVSVSSVVVTGPAHSGKTSVVECLLEAEFSLYLDCRLSTVYNSILRKLALKLGIDSKIRNKYIPTCSWNFWQTAGWAEVRTPVAFRDKLLSLLKYSQNTIYVVLDNAHYIDRKTYMSLQALASPAFVLIYVTNRVFEHTAPPSDAIVSFPPLGLKEVLSILRADLIKPYAPGDWETSLVDTYLAAWVPHMRQDFRHDVAELKVQVRRIWRPVLEMNLTASEAADSVKAKINNLLSRELRFEARAALEAKELSERICSSQSLSQLAARTVIAAFAAAHNPVSSDMKIFVPKKTKNSKRGVSAYKEARSSAVEISCRAPEPFAYNRLLAIVEYINEGELSQDAELLFTIKALCDQGLLVRCSTGDWLDGNLKFACHASHEFVAELAKHHNISLREIIY